MTIRTSKREIEKEKEEEDQTIEEINEEQDKEFEKVSFNSDFFIKFFYNGGIFFYSNI